MMLVDAYLVYLCVADLFYSNDLPVPYLTEEVGAAKGLERLNPTGVGCQQRDPLNPCLYYILLGI
jgi:hypothetical protein